MILFGDRLRRHLAHRHRDFKRRCPDARCFGKAVGIESAARVFEFHEIQGCEIACSVVYEYVFRAIVNVQSVRIERSLRGNRAIVHTLDAARNLR